MSILSHLGKIDWKKKEQKSANNYNMRVRERENREGESGPKNIVEEIIFENSPNLPKDISLD